MGTTATDKPELRPQTDAEIIQRVLAGEIVAYEAIMRRYNQRLYRAVRVILRGDDEAEDVLQETYVRAYQHLHEFAGEAQFSTWLTRIAVNEAFARLRRRRRIADLAATDETWKNPMDLFESPDPSPEQQLLTIEVRRLLEAAIDALPEAYRTVFVLREIEEMNTAEVSACLDLSEDAVKVRLHRARRLLRSELCTRAGSARSQVFPFMGERCDRVVSSVLGALGSVCGSSSA